MVSVVIPVYNGGRSICRAIDSVLRQSFTDYEIIVVNDGSTDNTDEIVKGYGDKVTYIVQASAGASVARNAGIAASRGEWIAFLDADDEWHEDKLARQMDLLGRNSELKFWTQGLKRFLFSLCLYVLLDTHVTFLACRR